MKRCAFIFHPLAFWQLAALDGCVGNKSPKLIKQFLLQIPPTVAKTVEVVSATGEKTKVDLICLWALPEQFKKENFAILATRFAEAFALAKRNGCQLVGLGAYSKMAVQVCPNLAERFGIAVTTGNSLTAALAVKTLRDLIAVKNLPRSSLEVAVVGATGSIGSAVARAIGPEVGRLNLASRSEKSLEKMKPGVAHFGNRIRLFTDTKTACQEAHLVFLATSEPGFLLQASDLPYESWVVDISKPANVMADPKRNDVRIIDCAMVAAPPRLVVEQRHQVFPEVEGLDTPEIFACFAETLVLSLQGRNENFSYDQPLDLEKFPEILTMARRHGFAQKLQFVPTLQNVWQEKIA